jgi:3-oxoacyl-[acyl-carrier protein] reductase
VIYLTAWLFLPDHEIYAQAFACDITDEAAMDRLLGEVIQAFGCIDVLIDDAA